MRKITVLRNSALSWFTSKVMANTVLTIVFTVIITAVITQFFDYFKLFILNIYFWVASIPIIIIICVVYKVLSFEKRLYQSDFGSEGEIRNWKNNELRLLGTATITEKALFLQFFDLPFTLKQKFPDYYAFEFKAKVLTDVFSWTVSGEISSSNARGYMFQYSPFNKTLRPHFLIEYNHENQSSVWVTPEVQGSPLRIVNNLELKSKNGWFHIRVEVRRKEIEGKRANADGLPIKLKVSNTDGAISAIEYDPANLNLLLEIRAFDLNNFGEEFFHFLYTEPPFSLFDSQHVGFRNCGYESAFYKDIKVYKIGED